MATRTISVDTLARVEGEGALDLDIEGGQVTRAHLRIFEPPRLVRGAFVRPRLHRGPRHHRAHLRHLPDRLSDEFGPCDGRRHRA